MRESFKKLVGKTVPFFDKSGGVLDLSLYYRSDWWNVSDFMILETRKKDFVAIDLETERKVTYRYSKVLEANEEGVVFG